MLVHFLEEVLAGKFAFDFYWPLSKNVKYAINAMEIVRKPKYVGSNNLEICLACMMQFSTPLSISKEL